MPFRHYIPEFKMKDRFAGQIGNMTVRRLLNHHSGIPGDLYNALFLYGAPWSQWGGCNVYMDWLLDYLGADYPSHPPGQMGVYSNTGFILAGEVALRADGLAGETFPDYLARKLFEPLGMNQTSLFVINENLATGYPGGEPAEVSVGNCTAGSTGGAFTTVRDMARFLIMVNNGGMGPDGTRILKPETIAMLGEVEKSSLDIDSYFQCGLGLDTINDPVMQYAGRAWMKGGDYAGFHSEMEMLPDKNLGVIVLSNSDASSFFRYGVVRECLKQAVKEKYGIEPTPPDLPTYVSLNNPSQIQGVYVKSTGYDKIVDNGDGSLTWTRNAQTENSESYVLTYQDDLYRSEGKTESVIFNKIAWDGQDYFVMIQSGSSGSESDKYLYGGYVRTIVGQKILVPALSADWLARVGDYVIDNLPWDSVELSSAPFFTIEEKDNLLIVNGIASAIPEDDNTAFVQGITSRSDSSIRVIQEDGKEKLLYGGYRGYAMGLVPAIASGDAASGTVSLLNRTGIGLMRQFPGRRLRLRCPPIHRVTR